MAKHGENIYKRKDGRYEGRYVIGKTIQGKTRFGYVYGRQYIEVKNLLIQKKAAQQKTNNGNSRDTVSEWIFRWMEIEIRGSVKFSSYQTYNNLYKKYLLPAFEGLRVSDVTPAVINDFISSLTASGLAYSTMKSTYRLLSAAMRSAQDEGLIHKNPCKKIRIQRTETKEQRILTHNEQHLIRRKATQKEELPVLLSLYLGLRLGEVCALKWSDIDWKKRHLLCGAPFSVLRSAMRAKRLC